MRLKAENKFIDWMKKRKRVISYFAFGAVTTILNIVIYNTFYYILHVSNVYSSLVAWFIAKVMIAFLTNKFFVFESQLLTMKGVIGELFSFMGCRIATGFLDLSIMYVAVDCLGQNGMLWKTISNIFVIILNYLTGKLIVFRKKTK